MEGKVFVAAAKFGSGTESRSKIVDFGKDRVEGADEYLSGQQIATPNRKNNVLSLLKKKSEQQQMGNKKRAINSKVSTFDQLPSLKKMKPASNVTKDPATAPSTPVTQVPVTPSPGSQSAAGIEVFSAHKLYQPSPKLDFAKGQVEGAEEYLRGTPLAPRNTLRSILKQTRGHLATDHASSRGGSREASPGASVGNDDSTTVNIPAVRLVRITSGEEVASTKTPAKNKEESIIPLVTPKSRSKGRDRESGDGKGAQNDTVMYWPGIGPNQPSTTPVSPSASASASSSTPSSQGGRRHPLSIHQQICAIVKYLAPTPEESRARDIAFTDVKTVCSFCLPNVSPLPFGSYVTGLCLPESDVDVTLSVHGISDQRNAENPQSLAKPQAIKSLRRLARALRDSQQFESVKVISGAKVPLVKSVHKTTGIAVDISIDSLNGVTSSLVLQKACLQYPEMRPLVLVLKLFLAVRGLNEPYSGGLGSYALALSVLSFLQNVANNYPQVDSQDLGQLLLHYFHFYGHAFPHSKVVICVPPVLEDGDSEGSKQLARRIAGAPYLNKRNASRELNLRDRPHLMAILDPINPTNVVTMSSYQITSVLSAFAHAYLVLKFSPLTGLSEILPPTRICTGIDQYRKQLQRKLKRL